MNGVFLLDKPPGPSSHDAVLRVRRLARQRRVGHAGTLDPAAGGLLVVLLGEATKLSPYLTDEPKEYEATVTLGIETDTLDAAGRVVRREAVPPLTRTEIDRAVGGLRGPRSQRPPRYSAVKVAGVPLYRHARAGRDVEAPARTIEVLEADLLAWNHPELSVRLRVSHGTYVRGLALDLAQALGTTGHCSRLRRIRSGGFDLAEATPLDDLTPDRLAQRLLPLIRSLPSLPVVAVGPEEAARLRSGQTLARLDAPSGRVQVHAQGDLVAVARAGPAGLVPLRTFAPRPPAASS